MLTRLLIDRPDHQYSIEGSAFLQLAQHATKAYFAESASLPAGDGSYEHPWSLDGNVATWVSLAQELKKHTRSDRWLWICGRYVKKAGGYYMVDAGGDEGGGGDPWAFKYNRDRTDPESIVKVGKFERGGPAYGRYSKRFDDQEAHSSKAETRDGDDGAWSRAKATKLRRVLKADAEYAAKLRHKGHLTTGQLLPVLAATMFLAEPARNPRAFLVNLLLLDMIEHNAGYEHSSRTFGQLPYSWKNVMWAQQGGSHQKGGLLPAAGTGSASAGRIGETLNMTQEKELDILLRYFTFSHFVGTSGRAPEGYTTISRAGNVPLKKDLDWKSADHALGYLRYLLQSRFAQGFDY